MIRPSSATTASTVAATCAVLLALAPAPAAAGCASGSGAGAANCFIVWTDPANADSVAQAHGLTMVRQSGPNGDVMLAEGPDNVPPEVTLQSLAGDPAVLGAEGATLASLSEDDAESALGAVSLAALESASQSGTYAGPEAGHFLAGAWNGYLDQPAVDAIALAAARIPGLAETFGTGVVAVIDTGVDPDHPLLQGALVPGYDFILDQPGLASEWEALDPADRTAIRDDLEAAADQSYSGILEGQGTTVAEGPGVEVIVDQSYSGILESDDLPSGFGHGTMVAGLVRLVAPGAKIMPLRVFDGNGTASLYDILRAIYFAADNGATVINMSFSTGAHSPELEKALKYASKQKKAVLISSSGNQGNQVLTYPAASGYVIGVASTNLDDGLSEFSSNGPALVTLSAPGEAVVTLYPGGLYAAAWGTSFSSALVSGSVALLNKQTVGNLVEIKPSKAECAVETGAFQPDPAQPKLGAGRLDVAATLEHGLLLELPEGPCT